MDYYLVTRDYHYIGGRTSPKGLDVLRSIGGPGLDPIGYDELRRRVAAVRKDCAILRTSGQFSLTGTLPGRIELDKALATGEDEMHLWSGPPTQQAPSDIGAATVTAVMRHFLSQGGTKATLHALVDVLEE